MRIGAHDERGFSLTELMLVVLIGLIIVGMAIGGVPAMLRVSKADGSLAELASALRSARESAISNRRNVQLTFGTNTVTSVRMERCDATCTTGASGTWKTLPKCTSTCSGSTTALRTVTLEGRAIFRLDDKLGDTPDKFGMDKSGLVLGSKLPAAFTTDGSLVDSDGDVLNASIFIGNDTDILSARAVTIFGPTGAMHLWRWDGRRWVEV